MTHGKASTYRKRGCRCRPCTDAAAQQTREVRRRQRAAAGLTPAELGARTALPGEEWRTVVGHPDYEVSSMGRVRSLKYTNPRLVAFFPNRHGYLRVRLYWGDNTSVCPFVHKLVAAAFIGPRPDGLDIRHLDDVKTNNTIANLAYGTRLENMADRRANAARRSA